MSSVVGFFFYWNLTFANVQFALLLKKDKNQDIEQEFCLTRTAFGLFFD